MQSGNFGVIYYSSIIYSQHYCFTKPDDFSTSTFATFALQAASATKLAAVAARSQQATIHNPHISQSTHTTYAPHFCCMYSGDYESYTNKKSEEKAAYL